MQLATHARPAQFDKLSQHRRAMIGKINVARHQLAMAEDDYRQGLLAATGKISLRECDDRQLERMIDWLRSKGFRPRPRRGGKPPAQHPMAKKARALWISLHHLGVVHNGAEEALEAFATRQLGCEIFSWARQSEGYKLIEALKAMAERSGWRQTDPRGKALSPLMLRFGLCDAILARLKQAGVAPDGWTLAEAAFRLCGIELISVFEEPVFATEHYDRVATALGRKLREARPGLAHEGDGQ